MSVLIMGGTASLSLTTAQHFLDVAGVVVVPRDRPRARPQTRERETGTCPTVETLDVTDTYGVLDVARRHVPTHILYLMSPTDRGSGEVRRGMELHTVGLMNAMEAARTVGVMRVVVASSAAVYASLPEGPFHEEAPLPAESRNTEEALKKALEVHALHYGDRTGLDVVVLRLGGTYGPMYDGPTHSLSRMCQAAVDGTVLQTASRQRSLWSAGLMRGAPFEDDGQDLCHVADCARGIQMVMLADALKHRIYNLGGGRTVTNREAAEAVREVLPDVEIPLNRGHGSRYRSNAYMDLTRIREDVGYEPDYDIKSGVGEYIAWLRERPV